MTTKDKLKSENNINPYSRKLSLAEKAAGYVSETLSTKKPPIPLGERLKKLTPEQKIELQEIEDSAIANYEGSLDDLESALGMLRIGHHMGWKVLHLIHSKKTIRKYEQILNIKIRDIFDEKGPSAPRSMGLELAEKFSNFWKVVSGDKDHKIDADKRKHIS